MKKFVCPICGYTVEAESLPDDFVCPQCGAPGSKFRVEEGNGGFVTEHHVGDGKVEDADIMEELRANFTGECTEVGMYLAKFAELLGEVLVPCTKTNVKMRAEAEAGACAGKMETARKAKAKGYDAIHDTVHEMAKDEARHGAGFAGLLKRYF